MLSRPVLSGSVFVQGRSSIVLPQLQALVCSTVAASSSGNETKVSTGRNHTPPPQNLSPSPINKVPSNVDQAHCLPRRHGIMNKMKSNTGKYSERPLTLLGIESSCDDTGVAVIDEFGHVLGEALHSQTKEHLKTGGIMPLKAADLHRDNIERVTQMALERSGRSLDEVGGIAVTVGPGMKPSLHEGIQFARKLAQESKKPLIPIHHMEAHALMPRIDNSIPFPYLVLLCSGGHCLLLVAHGVGNFALLGKNLDDSPGDVLDKCARMLRLNLHPEVQDLPGGAAIECMALKGDPTKFRLLKRNAPVMSTSYCCNFSFSGMRTAALRFHVQAAAGGWDEESPMPRCEDISATIQETVVCHITMRTHRAMKYCKAEKIPISAVVVSGGVAANKYLRSKLWNLTRLFRHPLDFPPPHLCTDNGVMIAWAGMERLKAMDAGRFQVEKQKWLNGTEVCWTVEEQSALEPIPRLPLGTDISDKVKAMNIKIKRT